MFQFQKVRLKVKNLHTFETRKQVSIPKGTIKRIICFLGKPAQSRFQFQKVRLKEKQKVYAK